MNQQRGTVYTFYSFKGGVGRSMAVANVAALMARARKKVLIIDWDLEAPGLEKYFFESPSSVSGSRNEVDGIVDIITGFIQENPVNWRSCLLKATPFAGYQTVDILSAGRNTSQYVPKLQSINWELLFSKYNFAHYLEALREEWIMEYDYVLIDSRTGITDIGGICTILLPDALVMMFTANEQSVEGTLNVIKRAIESRRTLPLDRTKLMIIPVPSRFETVTELELMATWKQRFADVFATAYADWLPEGLTTIDVVDMIIIPYVPHWSFGERLPVIKESVIDPRSISYAYAFLSNLLINKLRFDDTRSAVNTQSVPVEQPKQVSEPDITIKISDQDPGQKNHHTLELPAKVTRLKKTFILIILAMLILLVVLIADFIYQKYEIALTREELINAKTEVLRSDSVEQAMHLDIKNQLNIIRNESPGYFALKYALSELADGAKEDTVSSKRNSGPFVKKYNAIAGIGEGQPWACTFVCWCFNNGQQTPYFKSTANIITLQKELGAQGYTFNDFDLEKAQPGDIYFYNWRGTRAVGIVERIDTNKKLLYGIEGNSNDDVQSTKYYKVARVHFTLMEIKDGQMLFARVEKKKDK